MKKGILYFLMGSLPVIGAAHQPTTQWEAIQLICLSLAGGVTALKAYGSNPDTPPL